MKLIDANALYDRIVTEDESLFFDSCILDLILYEVGNVLWKHCKNLKTISFKEYQLFNNSISDLPLNLIRIDLTDFSLKKS